MGGPDRPARSRSAGNCAAGAGCPRRRGRRGRAVDQGAHAHPHRRRRDHGRVRQHPFQQLWPCRAVLQRQQRCTARCRLASREPSGRDRAGVRPRQGRDLHPPGRRLSQAGQPVHLVGARHLHAGAAQVGHPGRHHRHPRPRPARTAGDAVTDRRRGLADTAGHRPQPHPGAQDAAHGDGVRPRAARHPCGRAQPADPALGGSQVLADAALRGPGSGG